jgi:hypothetical protein
MRNLDPWEKYDRAIEHLRELDAGSGSYLEEIAGLIEELIARVVRAEERPTPPSQREVNLRKHELLVGEALARRAARYSSAAKDEAE